MRQKRQLGLRMQAFRLERRLTQEQLAEKLGRSVETISNLERGISMPSNATLDRLARALDVSINDLLIERAARGKGHPIEFFQATELLRMMDERKLRLALAILKSVAKS
jgi:transcriptional regulator with XRE-family HTH domain